MWRAVNQPFVSAPHFEANCLELNEATVQTIVQQVGKPLFDSLMQLGDRLSGFQQFFAAGSNVAHTFGLTDSSS